MKIYDNDINSRKYNKKQEKMMQLKNVNGDII